MCNGVFGVRPAGGQNGGSRRVQNGDCRADEEEHCTPRSVVIMQDEGWIHPPVWSNTSNSLLLTSLMSAHIAID